MPARSRLILIAAVTGAVALVASLTGTANAAAVILTLDDTVTAGDNEWDMTNLAGTSNGLPVGGECIDPDTDPLQPGFAIDDASTADLSDAYDYAGLLWVNDEIFVDDDDDVSLTTDGSVTTLTPSVMEMSGLEVLVTYRWFGAGDTAQILATFTNPGADDIAATVDLAHNWGSDDDTQVDATASGDTTIGADDQWLVTSDGSTDSDADPVNTTVFFGPGEVESPPTGLDGTVFDCSEVDGAHATYDITVPAGETRHLLFFNRITNPDGFTPPTTALSAPVANANEDVAAAAADFDVSPDAANELFSGIPESEFPNIVNWAPAAEEPTTTTTTTTATTVPVTQAPAPAVAAAPTFTG